MLKLSLNNIFALLLILSSLGANASQDSKSEVAALANWIKWAKSCQFYGTVKQLNLLNKHLLENLTFQRLNVLEMVKKLVGRSLNCKREIVEEILAHGERFLNSAKQAKTGDQVISNHSAELSDAEKIGYKNMSRGFFVTTTVTMTWSLGLPTTVCNF